MSDGFRVPGRPDGMYCVAGEGDTLVLLRNQENREGYGDLDPYTDERGVPDEAYDGLSPGGFSLGLLGLLHRIKVSIGDRAHQRLVGRFGNLNRRQAEHIP